MSGTDTFKDLKKKHCTSHLVQVGFSLIIFVTFAIELVLASAVHPHSLSERGREYLYDASYYELTINRKLE